MYTYVAQYNQHGIVNKCFNFSFILCAAIQVMSNTFVVKQQIQGLTAPFAADQRRATSGLNFDPRTRSLVSNGRPGHLQFYDVHNDTQLFNVSQCVAAAAQLSAAVFTELIVSTAPMTVLQIESDRVCAKFICTCTSGNMFLYPFEL